MLDTHFHQGMGLQCQQPQDELRLLVVTSQDDGGKTLATLWQLCGHMQRLGYPVVVLDATAIETDRAPGLLQLLTHAPWADASVHGVHADASALAVVPAALGLLTLANTAQRKGEAAQTLAQLEPIFRRYAVVVLYAPIELMSTPLLAGSNTIPLLITKAGKNALMECYRQIKHLALHANLPSMVAYLSPHASGKKAEQARTSLEALERCVAHHLGQRLRGTLLPENSAADMQRLALLLLDSASTISTPSALAWHSGQWATHSAASHLFQSH
ncbi:MAG: hypothetical protein PHX60_01225 [Giesbergeria sp.]|uniref:hypothetical protein n=1 Tax=Giesbergeria sp. TaxID=2818473 RepID=UPI00261B4306|nr:hypothetical protein [Giesbergeria sp.]MDD2608301.1 hypothetical protein [Giesbergeria sp.]